MVCSAEFFCDDLDDGSGKVRIYGVIVKVF